MGAFFVAWSTEHMPKHDTNPLPSLRVRTQLTSGIPPSVGCLALPFVQRRLQPQPDSKLPVVFSFRFRDHVIAAEKQKFLPGPPLLSSGEGVAGPLQAMEGGGDMSRQILHSVCAPFMRSPNGGRYALRIFPMRDLIRSCVSLWNSRGAVVNYC